MRASIIIIAVLLLAGCGDDDIRTISSDEPGVVKPYVKISSPLNNEILGSGVYNIHAVAFCYAGIDYVMFKVGLKEMHYDYSKPYECEWDVNQHESSPVPAGTYKICATAVDMAGNANSHCIKVEVRY